jgi:hypothetical protein
MSTPSRHAVGMLNCQALSTYAVQVSAYDMNRFHNRMPLATPQDFVGFKTRQVTHWL